MKKKKKVMKRRKMRVKKVKMIEKIPRTVKRRQVKALKNTVTKEVG